MRQVKMLLDKLGGVISYAAMRRTMEYRYLWRFNLVRGRRQLVASVAAVVLCMLCTGCMDSMRKHSLALSAATAPVVDQAAAAYRDANDVHVLRADYDAVVEFEKATPVYDPRKTHLLISDQQIEIRLAVLEAFQLYVQKIAEITEGTESKELDAASTSLGSNLTSLTNDVAAHGNATAEPLISATVSSGMSTGINALGQFLVSRKIKKELPKDLAKMDPEVEKLCDLLKKEIDVLRSQERLDFDAIIDGQTLMLRDAKSGLSAGERQDRIMKLPELARKQVVYDEELVQLRKAINKLELTHHAMAADAQGNNPESLKTKLGELVEAGKNLGKYYGSLTGSE